MALTFFKALEMKWSLQSPEMDHVISLWIFYNYWSTVQMILKTANQSPSQGSAEKEFWGVSDRDLFPVNELWK